MNPSNLFSGMIIYMFTRNLRSYWQHAESSGFIKHTPNYIEQLSNCTHRRETTRSETRSQPPAKRVNCTDCDEQSLNALLCWEWTQVPTGLHKAPLPHTFFFHGCATMNIDIWACQGSLRGRLMCFIIRSAGLSPWRVCVPTVAAQRDFPGTPLRVLGVEASGWTDHSDLLIDSQKHTDLPLCVLWSSFRSAHIHMQTFTQKPGAKWVQSGPRGVCPPPVAPAESTQWELHS